MTPFRSGCGAYGEDIAQTSHRRCVDVAEWVPLSWCCYTAW